MLVMLHGAGVYMVEDTLTSYWPNFKGGYHRQGTFMEYRCGINPQRREHGKAMSVDPAGPVVVAISGLPSTGSLNDFHKHVSLTDVKIASSCARRASAI